jgi:hypothetical protein
VREVWPAWRELIVYAKIRWPGITIKRRTLAVLAWPPAEQNEINRAVILRKQKMNYRPCVDYLPHLKEDSY